jgi:hypothetical protein
LLLVGHDYLSRGAGHRQLDCTHLEILAQRLRLTVHIENTKYPADLSGIEVLATKVKERHTVLHRRLHIGDQRQYMRDRYVTRIAGVNATAVHTTCALYYPEVFA